LADEKITKMQMLFRLVPLMLVILLQKANLTVDKTLAGPYYLVVGLLCGEDDICSANGSLYRETEGSQINLTFTANETELAFSGSCPSCILEGVLVYGLRNSTTKCVVYSGNIGSSCTVKEENGVIEINGLQFNLSNSENFTIKWTLETEEPGQPTTEENETGQTTTEENETGQTTTEEN
jgi:hypothetical protein